MSNDYTFVRGDMVFFNDNEENKPQWVLRSRHIDGLETYDVVDAFGTITRSVTYWALSITPWGLHRHV